GCFQVKTDPRTVAGYLPPSASVISVTWVSFSSTTNLPSVGYTTLSRQPRARNEALGIISWRHLPFSIHVPAKLLFVSADGDGFTEAVGKGRTAATADGLGIGV